MSLPNAGNRRVRLWEWPLLSGITFTNNKFCEDDHLLQLSKRGVFQLPRWQYGGISGPHLELICDTTKCWAIGKLRITPPCCSWWAQSTPSGLSQTRIRLSVTWNDFPASSHSLLRCYHRHGCQSVKFTLSLCNIDVWVSYVTLASVDSSRSLRQTAELQVSGSPEFRSRPGHRISLL